MFIAYDQDKNIWGSGFTKSNARKDARKWMKEQGEIVKVETIQCSGELYEAVNKGDHNNHFWEIKDGIAEIAWVETDQTLEDRIAATQLFLDKSIKNDNILQEILVNQLVIMKLMTKSIF